MLRSIREIQPRYIVGENVSGLVNWNGGMVFEEVQAELEAEGYAVTPFILPACAVNAPHRRDRVWFVAYSHNSGANKSMRDNREREKKNSGRAGQSQPKFREDGWNGSFTDTECNGHYADQITEKGQQYDGRRKAWSKSSPLSKSRNAADTCNEQLQRSKFNRSIGSKREIKEQSGQFSRSICTAWNQFPTQSPICSRNDGISSRLDGITFSKWRNESIKAGGNAIVPQVVFQIFKAIEEYDRIT